LNIKQIIKKIIPKKYHKKIISIKNKIFDGYSIKSYSQEGEDMILRRIFGGQKTGFYVDIGAHHPKRFSNTYFFYKNGWSGINIDATPEIMEEFKKVRSRDINLNIGISKSSGDMDFYIFNEPALNTFNEELSKERVKNTTYKLEKKIKVKTDTLENIFNKYLKSNIIDFMSIDAEGLDLQVLQSNNWEKFRPKYMLVESLKSDVSQILDCPINKYLTEKGYKFFAKTFNTYFYRDTRI